jgi:hypothetical protein
MNLQERLKARILRNIDDDPPGLGEAPSTDEPAPEETPEPKAAPDPVEVERLAQERVREILSRAAPPPTQQTPPAYVDPYEQARKEALQHGVDWDESWVMKRTAAIAEERTARRLQELEARFSQETGKLRAKDTTREIVGDDPHAQEHARRFLERVGGRVDDPELLDLLKRGARDYAREKAPKSTSMRVEPGYSEPVQMSARGRQDMADINAVISRINPKAKLTDEDLRGVA